MAQGIEDAKRNSSLMRVELQRLQTRAGKETTPPGALTCDVIQSRADAFTVDEIEQTEGRAAQLAAAEDQYADYLANLTNGETQDETD